MRDSNGRPFDHPCRYTCSGWKQGLERGFSQGQDRITQLEECLRVAEEALEKLGKGNRYPATLKLVKEALAKIAEMKGDK